MVQKIARVNFSEREDRLERDIFLTAIVETGQDAGYFLGMYRSGIFQDYELECIYRGWKMMAEIVSAYTGDGQILGYVKAKEDKDGNRFLTSFSAVAEKGHVPVVLRPGAVLLKED